MNSLQIILVVSLGVITLINMVIFVGSIVVNRKPREKPTKEPATTVTSPQIQKIYEVRVDGSKVFSEIDLSEIEKQAHDQLRRSATQAAARLQETLENQVDQLAVHISDMANNTLSQEFEKYQVSLEALREQSIQEFTKLQQELDTRRVQLTEHMDKVMHEETEKRMSSFNDRLNDVVASYVVESLGSQVDLGAQSAYIFEMLEKHKDDIKRDVLS